MATAEPKSKTQDGVSSSEEAVSSKATPNPRKTETGNTPATRTSQPQEADERFPDVGKDASRGPHDHVEASGRDHPSNSEQAVGQPQKLHGTSDRKINGPDSKTPKGG